MLLSFEGYANSFLTGRFPDSHFPEDRSPTDTSPMDISLNGKFPDREFHE